MEKAVGYARVSTEGQAENGCSLEMQREKLATMAKLQDAELVELVEDHGESGKDLNRPGMQRVLELVDSGAVDAVIIYKLDRLTRSVADLGGLLDRFEARGVALVSVSESLDTSTAAGRLVLNVMGSVAQWEREVIGERTTEALQAKRSRGERVGKVPFGYRVAEDGVTLEREPEEQEALQALAELRASGLSLRKTAAELNERGLRTRSGSPWRFQYVDRLEKRGEVPTAS